MIWSTPKSSNLENVSSHFVTSVDSGLIPNRPVICYAYGPPSVVSISLAESTRGLVISLINGDDMIPVISLGLVRDFRVVASHLLEEANKGISEQIIARALGIKNKEIFETKSSASNSIISNNANLQQTQTDDLWNVVSELRSRMGHQRLFPPGVLYWVHHSVIGI